jgi:hypothetical protein
MTEFLAKLDPALGRFAVDWVNSPFETKAACLLVVASVMVVFWVARALQS